MKNKVKAIWSILFGNFILIKITPTDKGKMDLKTIESRKINAGSRLVIYRQLGEKASKDYQKSLLNNLE